MGQKIRHGRLVWSASNGTAVRADRIGYIKHKYVPMKAAIKHNGGSRVFRKRRHQKRKAL